jgi:putative ABC transport system permease protein
MIERIPGVRRLFRMPLGRRTVAAEVDDELRFHLEARTEDLVRRGLSPDDARAAALREFGDLSEARDELVAIDRRRVARANRAEWWLTVWQDARYAFRGLRRQPGFAAGVLLTLALGIGANTAIFSVVEGVVLRSLPLRQPERLVSVSPADVRWRSKDARMGSTASHFAFETWRAQRQLFEDVMAYNGAYPILTGLGDPQRLPTWDVTGNFFTVLGAQPVLGRAFLPEDDEPGAPPVAVVSHAFWETRLGRDPGVIGRRITLDGKPVSIVGVMPPGFVFPILPSGFKAKSTVMWRPLGAQLSLAERTRRGAYGGHWIVARLRAGVTPAQAAAQLDAATRRLWSERGWKNVVTVVKPLREMLVGDLRKPLWVVLSAVSLVLLIACVNVANLLLARAVARQREIAIRLAVGAGRLRIARQLITEAVLLSLMGAALGVLLARWGVPFLVSFAGREIPRIEEVGINTRVLGAALVVSLFSGIAFGLVPAVHAVRRTSADALKEGGVGTGTVMWRSRASDAFTVAQIALALVLLAGAGLLARSFIRLVRVDTGFETEQVVVAELELPAERYAKDEQKLAFAERTVERVRAVPGVTAAAVSAGMPLAGGRFGSVGVGGRPLPRDAPLAYFTAVTPDYFRVLGIPLSRGSLFRADGGDRVDAVVVSEATAKTLFPGTGPIGKWITAAAYAGSARTIIGVVGDTRQDRLDVAPPPHVYEPLRADPASYLKVLARTSGDPAAIAASLRSALREIDPLLPVDKISTMRGLMSESLRRHRFYATLLSIFAATALTIAVAGLYAVVTYGVTRRTHEFGVRVALGAQRRQIVSLVVSRAMTLAAGGIALGLAGAYASTRLLQSFLFEVPPTDPVLFCGVGALLAIVAFAASYFPARRATSVDPMTALRAE